MLKISLVLVLVGAAYGLHAQSPASLAGTGWKGTMYAPDPILCFLKFGKDTLKIIYVGEATINLFDVRTGGMRGASGKDSVSIENMTYKFQADTLVLAKVDGGSPCDSSPGSYKIKVASDKMKLTEIKDPCDVRPYAFQEEMVRVW